MICVLASVVAAYAYLRLIVRIYFGERAAGVWRRRGARTEGGGLVVLAVVVVVLGVFPRLVTGIIEQASILRW